MIATVGVFLTYISVKHMSDQVRIMKEEQRARIESEGSLLATSEGTVWVGGPLGRFLKGAAQRLYGK